MAEEINLSREAMRDFANEVSRAMLGMQGLQTSADKLNQSLDADDKISKQVIETQKKYKDAMREGWYGLQQFNSALSDTTSSFTKYNQALSSGGKAVQDIASTFGILGKGLSVVIGAFTGMTGQILKATDAYVSAYDQFAKMGGNVGLTAKEIGELGKGAGYTYHNLDKFVKSTKSAQDGLLQLGGSASGGIKAFGKIAAVGEDQLLQYRRLGVSQEELTDMQATFVRQLSMTGGALAKTPQQLQKESLKYVDTLHQLADLTGQDVKKLQEKQDLALAQENFNAHIYELEIKRAQATDQAEKARLTNVIENTKQFGAYVMATDNAKVATAKLEAVSNEFGTVMTESTSVLNQMNYPINEIIEDFGKQNGIQKAIIRDSQATAEANEVTRRTYGDLNKAYGSVTRDLQELTGYTNEARKKEADMARFRGKTEEEITAIIEKEKAEYDKRKKAGQAGQAVMDAQTQKEAMERAYRSMQDALVAALNPFTSESGNATEAMRKLTEAFRTLESIIPKITKFLDDYGKALAIGIGALAGLAVLKSGFSKLKDLLGFGPKQLGTPGNPMHVTMGPGGPSRPGPAGATTTPTPPKSGGMTVAEQAKYERLRREGVPAAEAKRQAGGFKSVVKAEQKIKSPVPTTSGAMGQLGKGTDALGKLGEGSMLENIAKGLSAFANPKILLGATIFGSSVGIIITTIGAGIASASWLMGKALPTLVEGIQSFEKLNGDKLGSAGKGIALLGGGLAAFGAGGVLNTLGTVASSVTEFALNLFGKSGVDNSPVGKFIEFGKKLEDSKLNPERVSKFAEAFSAFGKGMAGLGTGNITTSVGSVINKLFNTNDDDAIKRFINFSNKTKDIDFAQTKKAADALIVFSNMMTSVSAPAVGITDLVAKLFGEKDISRLTSNLVEFDTKTKNIEPERAKKATDTLVYFSKAMGDVTVPSKGITDLISGLFGQKDITPIISNFVKFSEETKQVDPDKAKRTTEALVNFSKGISELDKSGTSITGMAVEKIFGKKDNAEAIKRFIDFTKLPVDADKADKLAGAFKNYAEGLGLLSPSGPTPVKPTTPAPTTPAGAKPTTPAPSTPVGAKPTTPAPSTPVGAKPTTPPSASTLPNAPPVPSAGGGRGFVNPPMAIPSPPTSAAVDAPPGSHTQEVVTAKSSTTDTSGMTQAKEAGLTIRPFGDVAHEPLTDKTLDVAKQIQSIIPGFAMYTGLNDKYHKIKHPSSKHAQGQAVDFVVGGFPTPEEAQDIISKLKSISGVSFAQDEYYYPEGQGNPSRPGGGRAAYTTGPHFHTQVSAAAEGIAEGPMTGYPATLHGTELIKKITKGSILDKLANTPFETPSQPVSSPSNESVDVLKEIKELTAKTYDLMETKLSEMIDNLEDSVGVQQNIYRQAAN